MEKLPPEVEALIQKACDQQPDPNPIQATVVLKIERTHTRIAIHRGDEKHGPLLDPVYRIAHDRVRRFVERTAQRHGRIRVHLGDEVAEVHP